MLAALTLLFASALAAPPPAIQVEPTVLEMSSTQTSADVWVSNATDHPWTATAQLHLWTQHGDAEHLDPTTALAVSPGWFTVQPGQRQRLRVVRVQLEPGNSETAYRLVLQQQPDPDLPRAPLLRHSSAVFVAAAALGGLQPALSARLEDTAGRGPGLLLHNAGHLHARVTELAWIDPHGHRHVLLPGLAGYVLAGASRRWTLPPRADRYAGGQFQAQINQGPKQVLPEPALAPRPTP